MDIATDISRITHQEQRLRLARFDANDAWQLGTSLREMAREAAWR